MAKEADGCILSPGALYKVSCRKALRAERKQLIAAAESEGASPSACTVAGPVPKDGLEKARLYLSMSRKYWMPPVSTVIFHCRRMAKAELTNYQLLEEFSALKSVEDGEALLCKAEGYRDNPGSFQVDDTKAQKERELKAQTAYEGQCRKKYEARMARKAKSAGRPLSEFLKASSTPGGILTFTAGPSWLLERDGDDGGGGGGGASGAGRASDSKGTGTGRSKGQGQEKRSW